MESDRKRRKREREKTFTTRENEKLLDFPFILIVWLGHDRCALLSSKEYFVS